MTTIILIALYIGHIFLSRRLCKLAYKNGFKNISYDFWWSWFIPLAGILWAALDYTASLRDLPEEQRKMKRNWFTGKDW